ncbi:hypothetical protein [Psychrobacillus sp. BM2]|uniref:hypothetical protein n=1 Tax=Psychrobacillus sp. BM2 TaxID=3400421 RepID=UPI003B029629
MEYDEIIEILIDHTKYGETYFERSLLDEERKFLIEEGYLKASEDWVSIEGATLLNEFYVKNKEKVFKSFIRMKNLKSKNNPPNKGIYLYEELSQKCDFKPTAAKLMYILKRLNEDKVLSITVKQWNQPIKIRNEINNINEIN